MGKVKQYTEQMVSGLKLSSFKSRFSKKGKSNASTSMAIDLTEQGFAIAEVTMSGDQVNIVNCQFVHNTNTKIRGELISELIQRRNINCAHTTWVLSGNTYKFLLAEAPNTQLESLRAIMPIKIKDSLLPWKVAEVTSDVLLLPPDAFRGRKKSVYVAASQTKVIETQLQQFGEMGIKPEAITTIEVALKAYWAVLNPPAKTSIGIMRITETGGVIVMVCDGSIYLARRIVVALNGLTEEGANKQDIFDQVVLEIQRSVDFYESQLGKGPVSKVVMLPSPVDLGIGFDYIEQNISTDIEILDPFKAMNSDFEMVLKDQAYCVGALGAAIEGLKNV